MGQEKVNIGKMVNKMQLLKPEVVKSATGEAIVEYKPDALFLSEMIESKDNSERIDDAFSGRNYLKFNAPYYAVTTDWKVEYNSVQYDIDKITLIGRGLYAMYECSKMNLE
ncbi:MULTISPECIES: hypothetical protein [Parabacteroides]|jgi:hypothetical protein|uniref:PORTAL PROTEIN, 15 PROTEIN, HEAD PROTEIN, VIRAL INFECTION, TAILED.2A n=1 Tax=Siphoviridae sp. ct7aK2 TaxID=2825351 RepID=A0A8S5U9K5_9CAUD|nr:hypothetical protein [Parabacteroides goldsteinii]DAF91074.1 MAG TPA: PORTAL PROTEIN, 15 PROTEIN, HEAD PROTEIN, VIRAL INFECTION, TAILED.2A [Siphoviridae sp. ct7aK2]